MSFTFIFVPLLYNTTFFPIIQLQSRMLCRKTEINSASVEIYPFQPLRYTGEGTEKRALPKKTDRKKRNAIVEIRDREIKQQRYVTQRPWRRARGLGRKKKIPSIFTINSCSGRKTQIKTRNSSLKFCFNGLFFAFSGVESTQIVQNLSTVKITNSTPKKFWK